MKAYATKIKVDEAMCVLKGIKQEGVKPDLAVPHTRNAIWNELMMQKISLSSQSGKQTVLSQEVG